MAIYHATEATGGLPNSGRLSGTNGDWAGIAAVVFPAAGWSTTFASGNAIVVRPPSGNRFYFCFNDDSTASGDARLCVFRIAESVASATSWTDPMPTVAEVADGSCNLLKSSTATTTARNFDVFIGPTWFMLFVNFNGTTNNWDFVMGGDCSPTLAGDSYNTSIFIRNSSAFGVGGAWTAVTNSSSGVVGARWQRSYDATVKATSAAINFPGTTFGIMSNAPAAQGGPSTGIDQEKASVLDTGATSTGISTTLGLPRRGYFPNLWIPMHGGRGSTINARDTWVNNAYNPSASFMAFCQGNTGTSGLVIVETTDTWSAPVG